MSCAPEEDRRGSAVARRGPEGNVSVLCCLLQQGENETPVRNLMSGFRTIAGTDSVISTCVIRVAENDNSSSKFGDQRLCIPRRQPEWFRNPSVTSETAGAMVLITWGW